MVDVSLQRYEWGFLHWERAMRSVPNVGAQHPRTGGGRPRADVECSAHLLPCGSGRQDVQLGELSRVFLGLEAQRGNT